ncbi:MAG: trypsin-like peptidase domain-containing protein, partial [Nostoc sp. EkiNYC01]|nr:serine protease [Nostoc sp. EkiNYC01]
RLRLHTVKVKSGSLGVGSGVIWQSDGLIITNAHVATSNRATVELADGRVFDAVRTQFDPQQDLAALKIVEQFLIYVAVQAGKTAVEAT